MSLCNVSLLGKNGNFHCNRVNYAKHRVLAISSHLLPAKRLRFSCNSVEDVTRCLYDSRNVSRVPEADSDEVASVVVNGTMFTVANGTGTTFNV